MVMNTADGKAYLTATEAARIAGVPGRTVRYWATRGKVGTRDSKNGRLVRLSDVQEMAAHTRQHPVNVAEASDGNIAGPGINTLPQELAEVATDAATQRGNAAALAIIEAHERELAAVRADAATELAARDAALATIQEAHRVAIAMVEQAHLREMAARDQALGATEELLGELRQRTELAEGETVRLAQLAREQQQARKEATAALTEAQHRVEQAEALAKHFEAEAGRFGRIAQEHKGAMDHLVDTQVEAMSRPRRHWWRFWG
jgi:hypothetical protein